MPAANIKINGVAASNDDVPINTVVQLDNLGIGGETTYAWTIVSQPEGTADTLSSGSIQNPTFTPKKEGSYRVQLTVNGSLIDDKIVAVRDLKTRGRAPAAYEKTEVDTSGLGWATAMQRWLGLLSSVYGNEQGVVTCYCGQAMTRGNLVTINDVQTIKSGLPGQEDLLKVVKLGTSSEGAPIGICEGKVGGSASAVIGDLVRIRFWGLYSQSLSGSPLSGDPVYHNLEVLSLTQSSPGQGRVLGFVVKSGGGSYRVFLSSLVPALGAHASYLTKAQRIFATWGISGVPANAVTAMNFPTAGSGIQNKAATGTYVARKLEVDMDINAAGATLTIEVYLNGVATGKKVTIAAGSKSGTIEFDRTLVLDSGGAVDVRVSTPVGWTATTAKVTASLLVEDIDDGA